METSQKSGPKLGKRVYCMRGIPGKGKSTVAEMLREAAWASNKSSFICSNDNYIPTKSGKMIYTEESKALARESCRSAYTLALERGVDVVIVDNVNHRLSHMDFFKDLAEKFGYSWTEVTVGDLDVEHSFKSNEHGVPKAIIEGMAKSFERR